jgi:hypothetical protein
MAGCSAVAAPLLTKSRVHHSCYGRPQRRATPLVTFPTLVLMGL